MKSRTMRSVVLALSAFFDVLLNRGEFQCPILPREYRQCPRRSFSVGMVLMTATSVKDSHYNRSRIGSFRNQLSIETYFITMVRYYSVIFFFLLSYFALPALYTFAALMTSWMLPSIALFRTTARSTRALPLSNVEKHVG